MDRKYIGLLKCNKQSFCAIGQWLVHCIRLSIRLSIRDTLTLSMTKEFATTCFDTVIVSVTCAQTLAEIKPVNELDWSPMLYLAIFTMWYVMLLVCRWGHQKETFSALLSLCERNSSVTGGFPSQKPLRGDFMFFYLCLKKRLSKQSTRRWFKTLSRSLLRHLNVPFPFRR